MSSSESIRSMLRRESAGGEAVVRGWLRTVRHGKGVSFLDVSDGSCMDGLQVVASPETEGYEEVVKQLSTGCSVVARGELVDSPAGGQRFELKAHDVELVGDAGEDYPLQKKRHSFEFLRSIAHLRPRTNTIGAVLRVDTASGAVVRCERCQSRVTLSFAQCARSSRQGNTKLHREPQMIASPRRRAP